MIQLRDAILRVAHYFHAADPNCIPDDPDLADDLQVNDILCENEQIGFTSFYPRARSARVYNPLCCSSSSSSSSSSSCVFSHF